MIKMRPFRAIRPVPDRAADVCCLPYDVMDTEEARQMAEGKPDSFLHVIRSEIDLPAEQNPYDAAVYQKAKENFEKMQQQGVLVREDEASFYVYRLIRNGKSQTGIAAVSLIDDYLEDRIKKHELTRREKEEDRVNHIDTLSANAEPVFLAYRSSQAPDIEKILNDTADQEEPLYDVKADDGVQHQIYRIAPGEKLEQLKKLFSTLPCTYIADGHHRSASTVRVGVKRREQAGSHTGDEDFNWFLAVTFPDSQLEILPYNRAVKDLNGHSADDLLKKIAENFDVADGKAEPPALHQMNFYLDGKWYNLKAKASLLEGAGEVDSLDVSLLQNNILSPLLNIEDPRSSNRIAFVGGIRGDQELEKMVNSGKYACAFALHPTKMEQLFAIADSGGIMPPKSTWFEPKLRSGFLMHTL